MATADRVVLHQLYLELRAHQIEAQRRHAPLDAVLRAGPHRAKQAVVLAVVVDDDLDRREVRRVLPQLVQLAQEAADAARGGSGGLVGRLVGWLVGWLVWLVSG